MGTTMNYTIGAGEFILMALGLGWSFIVLGFNLLRTALLTGFYILQTTLSPTFNLGLILVELAWELLKFSFTVILVATEVALIVGELIISLIGTTLAVGLSIVSFLPFLVILTVILIAF